MAAVPLFNAAGLLEVMPGAGYAGFTDPVGPGEPERWQLSGRRTFWRLTGDDLAQAPALLAAARGAAGGARVSRSSRSPAPWPTRSSPRCASRGARIVEDPAARRRRDLRRRGPRERRRASPTASPRRRRARGSCFPTR